MWQRSIVMVTTVASVFVAGCTQHGGAQDLLGKILGSPQPVTQSQQRSSGPESFETVINEQFKHDLMNRPLTFQAKYMGMATDFKRFDRVEGYFNIILCDRSGTPCYQRFVIPLSERSRIASLTRGQPVSVSGRLMNRFLGATEHGTMAHRWTAPITSYHGVHVIEVDSIR